ncbi:MAG: ABC transporter permease [Thermoanaerobaculia bacterium]
MTHLLAAYTLWRRELVRFFRQPSRIFSAAASPLLFWLLIGTGLSSSFRLPGGPADVDYFEYFFPGTVVLLVLFAAIFSTISVIEDRHQGFLQAVLVAPVGRGSLVAGKVLGGATLAWLQGSLYLVLAPLAGIALSLTSLLEALGVLALLAVALTALGFAFAWRVDSTQGFHAVMNLLLVPMWLLSGAFFPLAGAPAWLEWVMRLNPLTYGMAALRRVLYLKPESLGPDLPRLGPALAVMVVCCGAAFAADLLVLRRGRAI